MSLSPGTRLGAYEIAAPLGAGGMGEVYRAHDTRLGRDVALKVLPADVASHADRLARFELEARTVAGLNHPNVVVLYSVEDAQGIRFLTMELVEGQSLDRHMTPGGLPVAQVLDLAIQLADSLAAAHGQGVVHRDLKPANVMVTREGRVKVLDFGLAKLTQPDSGTDLTRAATLQMPVTMPGEVMGTAPYMAPEQIRGEPVDARADVFALGILLYELLTGRRPFNGTTPADVMSAILREDPAPLTMLRPDVPPDLARIVRRCLAKDPERRMQTSKDVRNELEDLQRAREPGPTSASVARAGQGEPVERQLALTAAHVRQLSARNPRLVGHPLFYLDNRTESDTMVVLLHGVGSDYRRFEPALRALPYRAVAATLVGFAVRDVDRPVLGFDDHAQVIRILLRELVRECRPTNVVLVGHSAGADQFLRMIATDEGAGIEVAGLLALGPNVSIETCFVSRLFVQLDAGNPDEILETLKAIGRNVRPLSAWLLVQTYIAHTFTKFGSDLEPLRRYAADVVAPFESPGDPLAAWYRAARAKIPCVRFVFSNEEAGPAEALLARHLGRNVLGDAFVESSYVIEPVHHMALLDPGLVTRHVASVVDELAGEGGRTRTRRR